MSTDPKTKDTVSKEKKPKLMCDSFTIPKTEYAQIEALKARAMTAGVAIKKSELLRAGLMALTAMGDAAFVEAIRAVPALKTGRPSAQPKAAAPAESPTKPAAPQAKPAATAPTATQGKSSTAARTRKPAAPKPAASPAKAAAPAKAPAAKKPATPARKTPATAQATPVSAVAPAVPAKKAVRKS